MPESDDTLDVAALKTQCKELLLERFAGSSELLVAATPQPLLFRSETPLGTFPAEINVLGSLVGEFAGPCWHPVSRLDHVLQPVMGQIERLTRLAEWRDIFLTFLTYIAGTWAARLAEQAGASLAGAFHVVRGMGDLNEFYRALVAAEAAQRHLVQARRALTHALFRPPDQSDSRELRSYLLLRRGADAGDVQFEWLTPAGAFMARQALGEIIDGRFAADLSEMIGAARQLQQQGLEPYRQVADAWLAELSADLATARAAAGASGEMLGFWLFTGQDGHGMPLEAHLFIDPKENDTQLCVRRAQADFVLEAESRHLYYFSPGQVQSRVRFQASTVYWSLVGPEVRIPAGMPPWRHPYTGEAGRDHLERVPIFNSTAAPKGEAVLPLSPGARQLLPAATKMSPHPRAGGMCIPDRERVMAAIARRVREEAHETGQFDVLGLVSRVIALGRQALTRGHQRNDFTPLLGWDNMLYPVTDAAAVAQSPLAHRLFRYARDPA